jgi:ketosteroid isomerase-like protein
VELKNRNPVQRQPVFPFVNFKEMVTLSLAFVLSAAFSPAEEIRSTLESYVGAVRTFDVPALERVLAKDYVEVSPLGEVDDRERTLSFYTVPPEKRGPTPTSITISELNLRFVTKGVAIAIFRDEVSIEAGGRSMKLAFRVTSTLKLEKRSWVVVSNHFTALRK